jgi:hypothetical protein
MSSCGFTWPLADPNEEDRANLTTHKCSRNPGHQEEHRCVCGARPDDG